MFESEAKPHQNIHEARSTKQFNVFAKDIFLLVYITSWPTNAWQMIYFTDRKSTTLQWDGTSFVYASVQVFQLSKLTCPIDWLT